MLLAQLRNFTLFGLIFTLLMVLLCWVPAFHQPFKIPYNNTMPLYELFVRGGNRFLWMNTISAVVLIAGGAILLNYLLNTFEILSVKSIIPGVIYFLLMSCTPSLLKLHPVQFSNLFIILSLIRICSSYRLDEAFSVMFDAGLFVATASLFYFPSIIMFPVIWVALIVIRPYVWREWLISATGLLLPYLFVLAWYFYNDSLNYLIYDKIFFPSADGMMQLSGQRPSFLALSVFLAALLIISVFRVLSGWPVNTILSRNFLVILWWLLGLSLLAFLMAPVFNITYLSLSAVPISILLANNLIEMRSGFLADLLLIGLIALIVWELY